MAPSHVKLLVDSMLPPDSYLEVVVLCEELKCPDHPRADVVWQLGYEVGKVGKVFLFVSNLGLPYAE